MKKYLFRILVGLVTFGVGVSFVWIFWAKNTQYCEFRNLKNEQIENHKTTFTTSFDGGIEIRFNSFGKLENRPSLKFVVINHNSNPAKYSSFKEKSIWTFVKFNGKEKYEWRCGTGLRKFTLNSGKSFEIEVLADEQIYEFLKKDGLYEFGYHFQIDEKEAEQFWSEPIKISEELKKEIIKNAPKYLKHQE